VLALIKRLRPKEQRGSKPRCHLLTHGSASEVALRLTTLAAPFAHVSAEDRWMPGGFDDLEEAQLHRAPRLLERGIQDQLKTWWLAKASSQAKTPNFDIASTCTIEGKRGLILVEAKAHDAELTKEALGRSLDANSSDDRRASHETIGAAILEACRGLERATSLPCRIRRDSHYQMANRFSWAWKLTQLGVPVVLIYLGFLRATEMVDKGRPFETHAEWQKLVLSHSQTLFPAEIWGRHWESNGTAFVPLIKSVAQPLG
jgi:hypothetical protein